MAFKQQLEKAKRWFITMSFWKKIILIFTINTLILLIMTDTIMIVLFQNSSNQSLVKAETQKVDINQAFNTQITNSVAKLLLSRIDGYESLLCQILNVYTYFSANPTLYTSQQQSDPPNPKLTSDSSFATPDYTQTAIYYYTNTSLFYSVPYADELISKMIRSSSDKQYLKRINLYIQNVNNLQDLTIRTMPATNDFTVKSLDDVNRRFTNNTYGNFSISGPYTDQYSMSTSNLQTLMSIYAVINISKTPLNTSLRIMAEIELDTRFLTTPLQNLYYFSSASAFLMYTPDGSSFQMVSNTNSDLVPHANYFFETGNSAFNVNGVDYVSSTISFDNSYQWCKPSSIYNDPSNPFRCAIVIQTSQAYAPTIFVEGFLANENITLKIIIFGWSLIILLSTIGLATVVGNYIFSNLKILSTKMKQYIHHPYKYHQIAVELKELQIKGILRKLTDNLVNIIEKIEVRKKEKKDRIFQNYHPLNISEPKFQERQELNDYYILEELGIKIKEKTAALKAQAQASKPKPA